MGLIPNGMKRSDLHEASQMNEMKINNSFLNTVSGWHISGDNVMIEQMPIFGGYAGGAEETAICDVATTLATFAAFNGDIHLDGPIHIRWGNTTAKDTIRVAAHVACAMDYNTDVLLANQYYTVSGSGTEMCLLETAAQAIADTASGRELLSGVACSRGVAENRTTGLEARMMGEASSAICGTDVETTNKILNRLIDQYENKFATAPQGKTFPELYDIDRSVPCDEYLAVYEKALATISKCGLDF